MKLSSISNKSFSINFKLLISPKNDLLISIGEDGNIIEYNINNSLNNEELKSTFRDEILVNEILLKQQVIKTYF